MKAVRTLLPALLVGVLACPLALAQDEFPTTAELLGLEEALQTPADEAGALAEFIDGLVWAQQREHGLAALTVSIVRDDELYLARGYGMADLESRRPVVAEQTLFRIGSVSKTFTWTAVMMLAERGELDLDADVNEYLAGVEVEEAFDEPVTLRHLMHHRAGFEDTLRLFAVADDDPRSLSQLLAEHQPERVYPPGARTSYSNWGAALAAQIVENVAGMPYGDFLRDEILDPLAMHDTTWLAPGNMDEGLRARLATGYKSEQGGLGLQGYLQIGPYWPAGGIASTAIDMARWMRFHLNGGELDGVRLMRADTHERMWTRAFDDRPEAVDVAHGFQDRPYRGVRTLAHAGGTAAYLTNMVLVPELGLGIFLSQNSTHTGSPIRQLPDLVIDRLRENPYVPDRVGAEEAETSSELAGTYLNNRRVFSTFAAMFGALNPATVTPAADDAIVLSAGERTRLFRPLAGSTDVFEAAGGDRVAVIRDGEGRVAALADGSGVHTLERVSGLATPQALAIIAGLALVLAITTVLGAWRRFGRDLRVGMGARLAGGAALLGAAAMLVFVATAAALGAGFADFDISRMPEIYPLPAMLYTHYAGWGVAAVSLLMVLAQWPAWSATGLGWWRRLHFGAFTLAMLFLTYELWNWRVIGAPVV